MEMISKSPVYMYASNIFYILLIAFVWFTILIKYQIPLKSLNIVTIRQKKVYTHKAQNTLVHIQLLRTSTVLHSPMASCSQRVSRVVHSCYENNYILTTLWTSLLFHCVPMILILTQILSCYCLYRLINSYRLWINMAG